MKLNKSKASSSDNNPSAGDASMSPSNNPMGMGDPSMGVDPSMNSGAPMDMGDPSMNGGAPMDMGDPSMGGDPSMNDGVPMDMGDPSMSGDMDAEGAADDSTVSIINQLSPEDREAVRSYAESMLNRSEDNGEGEAQTQPSDETLAMESVIFTKKQLRKIMENVGIFNNDTDKKTPLKNKGTKSVTKKSPFNSPKF